jgi:hypothetical protein
MTKKHFDPLLREKILRKQEQVRSHIDAFNEVNSMFFKDCMAYLIKQEKKEIDELKEAYYR